MRARHATSVFGYLAASTLVLTFAGCGSDANPSSETASSASSADSGRDRSHGSTASDPTGDDSQGNDAKAHNARPDASSNDEVGEPQGATNEPRGKQYLVTEVVDGDTVHLAKPGETSVRIIGIDTPETVDPSEPIECGGPAASAAAVRLLEGKRVRLVYDPSQGRFDSYGRVLGYIDIPSIGDFGLRMIHRGLAAEYTYDTDYKKRPQYIAAQRRARNVGKGVWDRCGGVDKPLAPPKTTPETTAPPADSGSGCAPGYDPCVPPYPPDLDCADVDGPIHITGNDPHGFDADGDGIGCDT